MRFFNKFSPKHQVLRGRWLKKTLVLISLPLLVGTFVMKLLLWAEEPGYSEAILEVLPLDSSDPVPVSNNGGVHIYMSSVMNRMRSPGFIFLLGCQLAIHDLNSSHAFHVSPELKQKYSPEILDYASVAMAEMIRSKKLQPQDPMLDSLLSEILLSLRYDFLSLTNFLHVKGITSKSQIRIIAQSDQSQLSSFLVNTFVSLFIEFNKAVDNEQGQSSWFSLKEMVDQKRDRWEKSRETLRIKKDELQSGGPDENRQSILQKISLLETERKQTQNIINKIKKGLNKISPTKAVPVANPYQKEDEREKLLIELGEAQARIKIIDSELAELKRLLEQQDEHVLKPLREKEERLKNDYLLAEEQFEEVVESGNKGSYKLIQVEFGQTLYPNPFATWVLAAFSFTATFFLWILFLFRIGYLSG